MLSYMAAMNRWQSPMVLVLAAICVSTFPARAQQAAAPLGEWRQWTLDGKTRIEAAMRGVDSVNVILQSRDGRAATLPMIRLADADRAYVSAAIGGLVFDAVEKANAEPSVSSALGVAGGVGERSGWDTAVKVDPSCCEVSAVPPDDPAWQQAFRSRHFEFVCRAKLAAERQREVARLFELQYELHRRAGWGVGPALAAGKRLKVQLFDTEDSFAASGALPASGCDLDQDTGILRCTLEAAGLRSIEGGHVMESVMTPKGVARGVTLMILSDAIEILPLWMLNGMATCMGAIPVAGGTAWPSRMAANLKPHVKRVRGVTALRFEEHLTPPPPPPPPEGIPASLPRTSPVPVFTAPSGPGPAIPRDPPPDTASVEYASCAMLAYHFMTKEPKAGELSAMIEAARADKAKWDAYEAAAAKYKEEWDKIKARKDVVDQGGGRYLVPSSVTVPQAPKAPSTITSGTCYGKRTCPNCSPAKSPLRWRGW